MRGKHMIVLALDSSADTVAVAVLRDDEPLAERSWRTPRPTGRGGPQGGLLGVADATLADARVAPAAVELVAVATGPGSFRDGPGEHLDHRGVPALDCERRARDTARAREALGYRT